MAERCLRRSVSALQRPSAVTRFGTGIPPRHLRFRQIATAAAEALTTQIDDYAVEHASLRREAIRSARPFSDFLTDNFARQHDYLRISLTEKCNLRCLYCMPEEGVPQSPPRELLTTPEIYLLSSIFVSQGVTKIRLTGGEPTVRRDILPLMHQIGSLRSHGLKEICITTNGISLFRKLDSMAEAGLTGVNLSLDTLDPWQFQIMTRRKGFDAVMRSMERILEMNKLGAGIKLKVNCVVMRGMNEREILPFVEMGREKDIEVRFIEYMPFDGNKWSKGKMLGYKEMLDIIRAKYPTLRKVQDHKNDTSKTYEIPGFVGKMGFITSMTHNFCGSCNRLRITSDGNLKVCLFGNAEVSLRDILRESNSGEPIDQEAFEAIRQIEMDRRQRLSRGSQQIEVSPNEQRLLEVIGVAVKRKKEKHAGMEDLKHMKNRPMILIDEPSRRFNTPATSRICLRQQLWRKVPRHLLSVPATFAWTRLYSTSVSRQDLNFNIKPPKLTHVSSTGTAHMVSISEKSPTARLATAKCTLHFSNALSVPLIRDNNNKKGDVLGVARIAGIMAAKRTAELIPLCHPIAITHVVVNVDVAQDSQHDLEQKSAEDGREKNNSVSIPWAGTGQGDAYCWDAERPFIPTSGMKSSGPLGPSPIPYETSKQRVDFGRIVIEATVSCDGKTGVEMEALTAASVAALTVYDMCKAVDKGMRIEGLRVVRKEGGKSGCWVEGKGVVAKALDDRLVSEARR